MDLLMNLSAFDLGVIQSFMAVATVAEAEGITDLRFLRQRMQEHLDREHLEKKKQFRLAKMNQTRVTDTMSITTNRCPSCKQGILIKRKVDDIQYEACPLCRFSRMVTS